MPSLAAAWDNDESPTGKHEATLKLFERCVSSIGRLSAPEQDNLFKLIAVWPSFSTAQQQAIVMFILMVVRRPEE